jgi:hypothetical protein
MRHSCDFATPKKGRLVQGCLDLEQRLRSLRQKGLGTRRATKVLYERHVTHRVAPD